MTETKNSSPVISIVDESLQLVPVSNCKLFIEADADELAVALLSLKSNRYLAFKAYEYDEAETFRHIISSDELCSQKDYSQVIFSLVNRKSTLIPNAFYDDEKKAELLSFNHHIEHNEHVSKDDFRFFDAKNIYATDNDLLQTIEKSFPKAITRHCSTALIESVLLRHKNNKQPVVNANLHGRQLELAVVAGNQLLFYNAFPCPAAEDFIYYTMFLYEQLELNPESVALELSGKIKKNSALHELAKKYIRNINFAARTRNHNFSYGFETLAPHQHIMLFDLNLCVS